jgi:hypothetical protein
MKHSDNFNSFDFSCPPNTTIQQNNCEKSAKDGHQLHGKNGNGCTSYPFLAQIRDTSKSVETQGGTVCTRACLHMPRNKRCRHTAHLPIKARRQKASSSWCTWKGMPSFVVHNSQPIGRAAAGARRKRIGGSACARAGALRQSRQ